MAETAGPVPAGPSAGGLPVPRLTPGFRGLLAIGAGAILPRQLSLVAKRFQLAALARTQYLLMDSSESIIGLVAGLALCWYLRMGAAGLLTGMLLGAASVVAFVPAFVQRLRGGPAAGQQSVCRKVDVRGRHRGPLDGCQGWG